MGSSASRPARKLTKNIVNSDRVARSSQPRLPPQKLKEQYENQTLATETKETDQTATENPGQTGNSQQVAHRDFNQAHQNQGPEGRDGLDPTADQGFIDSINRLGRQVQTHTARNPTEQLDVTALKQLLNRKTLYEKGQSEVKAQLESQQDSRTMIHPRTLTAILNAVHEHNTKPEEVMKDYQVGRDFLDNLSRFRVASNVVIIEEDRKDDEIGPKMGQPTARAASEGSMIDYNGEMSEAVNQERIKQLRKRLE